MQRSMDMQAGITKARGVVEAKPVVVLRGITLDRQFEWVFAPAGWQADALEQRWTFVGTASKAGRRCLVTPSEVRTLISLYGERSAVEVPAQSSLSHLLGKQTLVVDILLATREAPPGTS